MADIDETSKFHDPLDWARSNAAAVAASLFLVLVALGCAFFVKHFLPISSISLLFLPAILVSASRFGLWPSLIASLASLLCYNFFFMPPVFSFTISDPENVVTLFIFSILAIITSNLAARMRQQAEAARHRAQSIENLYSFSRFLVKAGSLADLMQVCAKQISIMLKAETVLLLPEGDRLILRGSEPEVRRIDMADYAAAIWCWKNDHAVGHGADILPGGRMLFMPVRTSLGITAILGIGGPPLDGFFNSENRQLVDSLIGQLVIAIERIKLSEEREQVRLAAETEKLRSALLTSLSHDLRTPLASILGSATSLREQQDYLDADARSELAATIEEEAQRLNRFINNLLDMTKLESGIIAPIIQYVEVEDVVGSALRRAGALLRAHKIDIKLQEDLPVISVDPVLLEQVLFNLLDNAAKYAPDGSVISIAAGLESSRLCLKVQDSGIGIAASEAEHIFDKFYRIRTSNHRAGTGLGLAVCRGFVEAMGGKIIAGSNPARRGAVFSIYLPLTAQTAQDLRDIRKSAS